MAERFSLEFETDNAAFEGPDIAVEVARILRELAELLMPCERGSVMRGLW